MKVPLVLLAWLGVVLARPQTPNSEYGPPGGGYPKGVPSGGGLGASGDENADTVDNKSADNATVTDNETVKENGNDDSTTEQIIELTTVSEAPANYNFEYEVKDAESNNDFGHKESRMGHVAMGSYHVLLPDGRMQKVDYVADKDGYRPTVTYTGEAMFGAGVGGGKGAKGGASANTPGASYGPPGGGYYRRR